VGGNNPEKYLVAGNAWTLPAIPQWMPEMQVLMVPEKEIRWILPGHQAASRQGMFNGS
jgi:hypothetical protein